MVEVERSHRGFGSSTSDFFLCFSSRSSSSSSMKMSSKSILSPGRNRDPPTLSLSSSLSRRLRSNGSMKGGGQASPMFSTGSGKKKGGSFEPPEPSSPKVTCIGQVRVKSKRKHGRKLRTNRSQRRGEVSFRKTEQNQDGNNGGGIHHQQQQQSQQECLRHRNQRWVHLPLSICETLRAFGAEFNCFGPCGGHRRFSSCSWSNEREKSEKRKGTSSSSSSNSCGAVFARWLFALQESEEDKGKEIEQNEPVHVVRDEVEKRNYRENREIEMEITEEKLETRGRVEEDEVEEEEARESICIPPKNALLLMRSRSAPFRMSSLANRFWDSPGPQDKEEDHDEEEELELYNAINGGSEEIGEKHRISGVEVKSDLDEQMVESLNSGGNPLKEEEMQDAQSKEEDMTEKQEEIKHKEGILVKKLSSEDSLEEAMLEMDERAAKLQVEVVEKKEKRRVSFSSSTMYLEPESEPETDLEEEEDEEIEAILEERSQKSTEEESSVSVSEDEKEIPSRSTIEADQDQEDEQIDNVEDDENQDRHEEVDEEEKSLLPDCLLLMMCEPKLSMEVSKETWVCSRDFIRFRPTEKKVVPQKTNNGGDESTKKRLSTDTNPIPKPQQPSKKQQKQQQKPAIQIQPARSSCSKVEPLVAAIEKKLTDSKAYEPFVLKRCKSEPMRNSAKLAPEVCFWNKNKIETNHHQPPSVGVGATGIGF
ncbi:hypothetical protein ACHQM5_003367 [Ranunculus cassubicifolius]